MTRHYVRFTILAVLFLLSVANARAQVATGTPPFGSFSGGPDVVDNANLNVHFEIPVFSRAGRGIPFSYKLTLDSSVWYPVGASGSQVWTPVANWGWAGVTQVTTGYVTYTTSQNSCPYGSYPNFQWYYWTTWQNFVYYDQIGIAHSMPVAVSNWNNGPCGGGPPSTMTRTTQDGSGYSMTANSGPSATVYSSAGAVINAPLQSSSGNGSVTDSNGNQLTASYSSGTTSFYDTLSGTATALTASGSGTPSSPITYTYTGAGGGSTTVTMNYVQKTVQTNFSYNAGCSGITEHGATSQNLVNTIVITSGTSTYTYTIGYEATPGYPANVTGRIASIQLPTGGKISYDYTTGSNNGITCGDGSASGFKRTLDDKNGNVSTWTYAHSESGTAWTTTITDPNSKATTIHFQGIYETSRTLPDSLASTVTCYNGNTSNCDTTTITLPVTQRTLWSTLGGVTGKVSATYNTYGLPTQTDEYDYGASSWTRRTVINYASLGNNILDRPSNITICKPGGTDASCNSSGTQLSQTAFTYGNTVTATSAPQHVAVTGDRGNAIQITSGGLTRSFTYYDTGMVNVATDPNGTTTTYTYGACGNTFKTSTLVQGGGLSFSSSATYDCNGSVPLTATDANNRTLTLSYDNLDRALQKSSSPDGAHINFAYNPYQGGTNWANVVTTTLLQAGLNRVDKVQVDGLGRAVHQLLTSDPAGTTYLDTAYDLLGRVASVTNPYRTTCSPLTSCETQYNYDALDRVVTVTRQDGATAGATYTNNCATARDESNNARKICSDALGRLTQVFEAPSGLNYETDYTYDALDDLTQSQGIPSGQTRSFNYDSLGRLTSAATPETAQCTVNYNYNSNGDMATRVAPAPNQTSCSSTVTTTYSYDALHRLNGKTYSNGNPAVSYFYDQTSYNGLTITNGKGLRTGMSDGSGQTAWSYDAAARVLAEQRMNGSVSRTINYGYTNNGSPSFVTYPSGRTVKYDITGAGLPTYAQDSNGGINYALNASYAPQGDLSSMLEGQSGGFSGITLSAGYNNRLLPTSFTATSTNGTALNLAFSYFANGNVQTVTNNQNTNRTESLTYDSLNRLATAQSAATSGPDCWGQSIPTDGTGYDRYGNLLKINGTKTGSQCSQATLSVSIYSNTNQLGAGFSYDAAGNMTSDGLYSYVWDAEGRMTSAGSTSYTYDGDGKRVKKGASTLYWFGINAIPMAETDSSGNTTNEYIFFGGRIARRDGSGNVYYYFGDQIGSSRTITNATGTICYDADFYPFGGERPPYVNSCAQNYKFAGMERDPETGNDHTLFRQYPSNLGRWMSPDPLGGDISNPQSLNRYAYVLNNPATLTDPLGLKAKADPCDESDPTNKRVLDFISANRAAAEKLAVSLGCPAQNILGLSAQESTFGTSAIASNAHNFFGLHAGFPGATGTYTTTKGKKVSSFPASSGFATSGQSFFDKYGDAVSGIDDPKAFAQALHDAGFNTENPKFVQLVTDTIAGIKKRLNCPQVLPLAGANGGGGGGGGFGGSDGGHWEMTIGNCGKTSEDGGQGWMCDVGYTWVPYPIQRK